ncbi:hypothetical protein [Rhodoferax sp. BAB1]|uniref:hypothetical protein n=1 Tax=Rhodoferax sp. BAB1 TaxID=2741720 RepID=UPI001575034E|nr:hypothetical protein [Rhodoferax sp. BAB1]QKO20733.1 hypothetical protein HTY51_01945 [Rhodoferax sp. BAB1]
MKLPSHRIALLLLPLVLAATAQAQTVYRCGNSYSQQPCPGGNAIDATDSRSPEQRKAREASVKREQRSADTMEKTRQKEEAAALRAAEQTAKAERTTEKDAKKSATNKSKTAPAKDKLPAYRAPATAK